MFLNGPKEMIKIRVTDQEIHSCFWHIVKRHDLRITSLRVVCDDKFSYTEISMHRIYPGSSDNFLRDIEAVKINGYWYYGNGAGTDLYRYITSRIK